MERIKTLPLSPEPATELVPGSHVESDRGLTLIELVVVITLVGLIGSLVVVRMDSLLGWKTESEVRRFTHTLQLIRSDSIQRQERYRLVVNLDRQEYFVRREVPLDPGEIKEVDYLENLRTKGEQQRRAEDAEEELVSLDEEFAQLDAFQGGSLEAQYYQATLSDPAADVRLGIPLQFPSLAEVQRLDADLRIRDIVIGEQVYEEGTIALRFLSRAPAPPALIHFVTDNPDIVYTVILHSQLPNIRILGGDISAEDAFERFEYEGDESSF